MAKQPLDDGKLDESAYREADALFRRVSQALPEEALQDLAREVVRRLAFRMPRHIASDHLPTPEEIDRLCAALLSRDEVAGDRIILAARRDGVDAETIYLSYVAGAARRLGVMWEEDRISFLDVTLASGRLYRIIRGLRHVIDGRLSAQGGNRRALFALVPGETHTLGIEIATDIFRRRGWDVDLSVGDDHDEIVQRSDETRFGAVVLVANSEGMLANLIALVLSLRITQPLAHIVVAGNIVGQVKDVDELVGADAVLPDIETATAVLKEVIDHG